MKLLGTIITNVSSCDLLSMHNSEEQGDRRQNDHWVPVGPAG
jgi:hypothetical protein